MKADPRVFQEFGTLYGLAAADGVIRYVGRTKTPTRRMAHHRRSAASGSGKQPVHDWIRAVLAAGDDIHMVVLWECAVRSTERREIMVRTASGEPLLNQTDNHRLGGGRLALRAALESCGARCDAPRENARPCHYSHGTPSAHDVFRHNRVGLMFTLRADQIASRIYEGWLAQPGYTADDFDQMGEDDREDVAERIANLALDLAAVYMREAAKRDPSSGSPIHAGLPKDELAIEGAAV